VNALRPLALTALTLTLAGCVAQEEGRWTQLLGWSFADGRRCAEAGVVDVVVTGATANQQVFRCQRGEDTFAEVALDRRPAELDIEARSISGALFYEGQITCDGEAPRMVELRFVGGVSGP
jgi:hypothetical protein